MPRREVGEARLNLARGVLELVLRRLLLRRLGQAAQDVPPVSPGVDCVLACWTTLRLTVPRIRLEQLLNKSELDLPHLIPPALRVARSLWDVLEAPHAMRPDPVHLRVHLEVRHRQSEVSPKKRNNLFRLPACQLSPFDRIAKLTSSGTDPSSGYAAGSST